MWDYDKLFAEGNVVGLRNIQENRIFPATVKERKYWGKEGYVDWSELFNKTLSTGNKGKYEEYSFEVMYVIHLDEHGNVVERLFDREKDMPSNPMPDLEDNMFIRVQYYDYSEDLYHPDRKTVLGYVDMIHNRILYQDGRFAKIEDGKIKLIGCDEIVEVYKGANSFGGCLDYCRIWRNDDYQSWLNLYETN